ncbi:MAG: single-stranded DNA-binding protein [Sporichthyaceae bacterium]
MNSTHITIAGNCGDEPQLRFTTDGKATTRLRVAVTERFQNATGSWLDGPTSWHTVLAWGPLAEQVAETVCKGDRVLVCGRLAQREWTAEGGERRSAWEITAEDIGPSLRHATGTLSRNGRPVPAQH